MSNSTSRGGTSFFALLGVLFIGLKLTNYIDWSWWLVLSPIIAGALLTVFVIFLALIIGIWADR